MTTIYVLPSRELNSAAKERGTSMLALSQKRKRHHTDCYCLATLDTSKPPKKPWDDDSGMSPPFNFHFLKVKVQMLIPFLEQMAETEAFPCLLPRSNLCWVSDSLVSFFLFGLVAQLLSVAAENCFMLRPKLTGWVCGLRHSDLIHTLDKHSMHVIHKRRPPIS